VKSSRSYPMLTMIVMTKLVVLLGLLPFSDGATIRGASSRDAHEEPVWLLTGKHNRELVGSGCPDPGVSV
jgi:hypothetical protein